MSGSDSPFKIENNVLIRYTGPKDAAINIPDGVAVIGDNVFIGCTGFISIPNSVTTISHSAFCRCIGLTVIPDNVMIISMGAFACCTSLTTIPNNMISINDGAFDGCTSLTQIPNGVVTICFCAFRNCTRLTTIPNTVTTIGDIAFCGCTSLTTIPNSVRTIGWFAFAGCSSLESCELNTNVILEADSFQGCANLKHLFIADDQVERIKAILPDTQKHLVFGKSSEEYKLYSLDKNHDEEINQMIGAAYKSMLPDLGNPDVASTVCAFLNQRELEAVATTNKFNANLFKGLNAVEEPGRPLSFSSVEKYEIAMAAYKDKLATIGSLGEEVLARPLKRIRVSHSVSGAGAGAGAGASL